ncbi:MAG: aspartate aminotransferase family protein [Desulfobacterales bacterium]
MALNTTKSQELYEHAKKIIPGAVMSNFRKDEDYRPTYISHGKGARLFDVDGNEYIDYLLSFGPAILGHSNEHLRKTIKDTVDQYLTNNSTELEIKAAEKVAAHLPSAELVRFACSGTDAVYNAMRAARGYTGRNMVVRFNGHYNGGLDEIMGGIVTDILNPIPVNGELEVDIYSQVTNTDGRGRHAFADCYMIEWNDLPALENLISRNGKDIAAVLMEPVMVNMSGCLPEPGYLEGVRELCDTYGIVLIFDEVLTGFRMGLGGAQGHFGITPDLTCLAKAIGGGFPVSSFCGKREIMDCLTRTDVVAGGTYNGHPISMAAVIATIEELEKDDGAAFKQIEKCGNALKKGMEELAAKYGHPFLIQGFPGAWNFLFTPKEKVINHNDSLEQPGLLKALEFTSLIKKQGVLAFWRFCTSAAHTEKDIQDTLERVETAFKKMK